MLLSEALQRGRASGADWQLSRLIAKPEKFHLVLDLTGYGLIRRLPARLPRFSSSMVEAGSTS
jgi:hypothetical protein